MGVQHINFGFSITPEVARIAAVSIDNGTRLDNFAEARRPSSDVDRLTEFLDRFITQSSGSLDANRSGDDRVGLSYSETTRDHAMQLRSALLVRGVQVVLVEDHSESLKRFGRCQLPPEAADWTAEARANGAGAIGCAVGVADSAPEIDPAAAEPAVGWEDIADGPSTHTDTEVLSISSSSSIADGPTDRPSTIVVSDASAAARGPAGARIEALRSQLTKTHAARQRLRDQNDQLQARIAELKAAPSANQDQATLLTAELESVRAELSAAQDRRGELVQEVNAERDAAAAIRTELRELRDSREGERLATRALDAKRHTAIAAQARADNNVARLTETTTSMQQELRQAFAAAAQADASRDELATRLAAMQLDAATTRRSRTDEVSNAQGLAQAARLDSTKAEAQVARLTNEVEAVQQQLRDREAELHTSRTESADELHERALELTEARSRIHELEDQLADRELEHEHLAKQAQAQQRELATIQENAADLGDIDQQQQLADLDAANRDLRILRANRAVVDHRYDTIQAELAQAQNALRVAEQSLDPAPELRDLAQKARDQAEHDRIQLRKAAHALRTLRERNRMLGEQLTDAAATNTELIDRIRAMSDEAGIPADVEQAGMELPDGPGSVNAEFPGAPLPDDQLATPVPSVPLAEQTPPAAPPPAPMPSAPPPSPRPIAPPPPADAQPAAVPPPAPIPAPPTPSVVRRRPADEG